MEEEILKEYKDVINFRELKEILGISKNTLYKMLQNQEIPNRKVGQSYKILKTSVIKYLLS